MKDSYYTKIEIPSGITLNACSSCGSEAGLFQYLVFDGRFLKAVRCLDDGQRETPCVNSSPYNNEHFQTKSEAIREWGFTVKREINLDDK